MMKNVHGWIRADDTRPEKVMPPSPLSVLFFISEKEGRKKKKRHHLNLIHSEIQLRAF